MQLLLTSTAVQAWSPLSPDATNRDWPCEAICWNAVFSLLRTEAEVSPSPIPHEQLTIWALLSLAIWLKMFTELVPS